MNYLSISAMVRRGLKLAVVAACIAAASASQDWTEILTAFAKFQQDFEKTYEEAEKELRFGAFAKNYAIIWEENAKGHSYTLGFRDPGFVHYPCSGRGPAGVRGSTFRVFLLSRTAPPAAAPPRGGRRATS